MKKFILSVAFVSLFGMYAVYQSMFGYSAGTASAATIASAASATKSAPLPKSSTLARGGYRNGTYTGSPADAYYGTVQVKVTVAGGKITDVAFLNYPQDRSTSRGINSYAMPQLTEEAISAQSANVNTVSGASDTSAAFRQSLASALSQAA